MNATATAGVITDEQWPRIAALIPPERGRGRHRSTDLRAVVEAIVYRHDHRLVWRRLPKPFPPWATVYTYARDWRHDGTLARIGEVLGRELQPAEAEAVR